MTLVKVLFFYPSTVCLYINRPSFHICTNYLWRAIQSKPLGEKFPFININHALNLSYCPLSYIYYLSMGGCNFQSKTQGWKIFLWWTWIEPLSFHITPSPLLSITPTFLKGWSQGWLILFMWGVKFDWVGGDDVRVDMKWMSYSELLLGEESWWANLTFMKHSFDLKGL